MVIVESSGDGEQQQLASSSNHGRAEQQQQESPTPEDDSRVMLDRVGPLLSRGERMILERMIERDGNRRVVEEIQAIARENPAIARLLSAASEERQNDEKRYVESARARLRRAIEDSESGQKLTAHLSHRVPPEDVLSNKLRQLLPARTLRDVGGDSGRLLDTALRYDDGVDAFVRALRASRHHKSARELDRLQKEAESGYEEDMRQVRKRKLAAMKIPKIRTKFIE